MYQLEPQALRGLRRDRWWGIGPNVLFLGLTSMLTDISSEMVASILPIYLVFSLQLTPMQFGLIDGLYQGAASLARLAGGLIADRWQRNREVAAAGYGLSALCKLGLLAAGNAWGMISTAIALDRIGKGIRTAPRDALISLSAEPSRLGLAFGLHRALDTAGALAGPIFAFLILASLPHHYDVVFVVSFFIAAVGLAMLLIFVRNVPPRHEGESQRPTAAEAIGLLRLPALRRIVFAGAALGLVTIADSFFFLLLQQRADVPLASFPLLYVASASVFLLLAVPAGRLGDNIGRGRVFLFGYLLLLLAFALLWAAEGSLLVGIAALGLLGAYYACTDGVLMAAASQLLPERLRASGLALVLTAIGLARLIASLVFGSLWSAWTIELAFAVFASAMVVVLLLTARIWLALE